MSEYEWIKITAEANFAPRDGAGALVFNDKMWLLGGWNPEDPTNFPRICNNEVWSSTDGANWTLEKPGTFGTKSFDPRSDWEGRHAATYTVFKNRIWIIGGDANQHHYQYDVWNSADGKIWNHVNEDHDVPWGPRAFQYSCVFKNKLWIMGGQTIPHAAEAEDRFYGDVWNSSDGLNWTQIVPKEPYWQQRGLIGGRVVFKDRIWVLGGGAYWTAKVPEPEYFNDVWSSADGVNWQCHLEHAPWQPRVWHDVAVFDGKMWVMEGVRMPNPDDSEACEENESQPGIAKWISFLNLNDVWYSEDGVTWHEIPDTPWVPRHAASVFVYDNALWMVAGNNMESDVWKLVRTCR